MFKLFKSFLARTARSGSQVSIHPSNALTSRGFIAAQNSRLLDWAVSFNKLNHELKLDYRTLVQRSRDLAKNNEFVCGYLENLRRNVIGAHGFSLQSKAEPANFRKDIEKLWQEYQSRAGAFVTLDEHQSGRDFDNLVMRSLIIDGEVFIHRVFDPSSRFGFRYEIIDSLEIDPLYNVARNSDGETVTMGIKYDRMGREISYFWRDARNEMYMTGPLLELPAKDILHIYRKNFPDQVRGYPVLAPVIMNLGHLDAYKEAEIVHARIQAAVMGIWERDGSAIGDILSEETDENGEVAKEIRTGSFKYAPKGYKASFLSNTSPNNQFGIFWKNLLRSITNALGISYNKGAGDYESVNYSSLREATLEDRANFEELQTFFIENWKDVQFRDFIRAAAANGLLPIGKLSGLYAHRFFGRRFPWVDPQKEISAKEKEFDLLLTDPISELEQRGIDPDELIDRWADWNAKLKAKNIPFMVKPPIQMAEPEKEETADGL